jgi:hypothetical protein
VQRDKAPQICIHSSYGGSAIAGPRGCGLVCNWAVPVAGLWPAVAGPWLVCGWAMVCGWVVPGLWLAVAGLWLVCGWAVAQLWLVCGWSVAGLWLSCGWLWLFRGWSVAGLWLLCGWSGWAVAGLWLGCGWAAAGLWLVGGWSVAGLWLVCGWAVAGLQLVGGWSVAGLWLVCGWSVAGLWLGCGWLCLAVAVPWLVWLGKQLIRRHETHTFRRDLQNRSFRVREMPTFKTPSSHPPWMTQARLAQWQPRTLAVKINVRASAAECDFFIRPRNSSDQNALTKHDTFVLHSNLFRNRSVPGQAVPGQAGPGWSGTPARAGSRPAARFGKLQKNS